jgi:hypothetical protein
MAAKPVLPPGRKPDSGESRLADIFEMDSWPIETTIPERPQSSPDYPLRELPAFLSPAFFVRNKPFSCSSSGFLANNACG